MKNCFTIIFLFIFKLAFANMSSPIMEGTLTASPLTSKDIDILKENIQIKIDKSFHTASFDIQYHIKTDVSGEQIPLLFYAKDYKGEFRIWVDEKEIKLLEIPYDYSGSDSLTFSDFSGSFTPTDKFSSHTLISWEENTSQCCNIHDLKYFKINLEQGEHIVHVTYTANVWTDTYNWVNEYSFRYSLSPAKYWRSFGSLEISLQVPQLDGPLTVNLGNPGKGNLTSIAEWKFSKLPADFILINYQPEVNLFAKILIAVHPIGLSIMLMLVLFLFSYKIIVKYKKNHPEKKRGWLIYLFSGLSSFLILLGFILFFPFIDVMIGSHAGEYHGYTFIIIILFPILAALYGLALWLVTRNRIAK